MGEVGAVFMVALVLMITLVLAITVALVPRLLVAVGSRSFSHRHAVVAHVGHRGIRHSQTSPPEEETKQHSCQEANEAHACR
jgi:hypothetical protein